MSESFTKGGGAEGSAEIRFRSRPGMVGVSVSDQCLWNRGPGIDVKPARFAPNPVRINAKHGVGRTKASFRFQYSGHFYTAVTHAFPERVRVNYQSEGPCRCAPRFYYCCWSTDSVATRLSTALTTTRMPGIRLRREMSTRRPCGPLPTTRNCWQGTRRFWKDTETRARATPIEKAPRCGKAPAVRRTQFARPDAPFCSI